MFHDRTFPLRRRPANDARREAQRRFQETAGLFLFGLAVLAFLVAIDRPEWFHIRPATGTSVALSHVTNTATNLKHP